MRVGRPTRHTKVDPRVKTIFELSLSCTGFDTHLDGHPMGLGGLGALWAVHDADRFLKTAAKPVNQRFAACPWATNHTEVSHR